MSTGDAASLLEPALLERVKGLSLVARRVVEGVMHGLHRSVLQGLSIEFVQHREYSPGDELKRLDWQVFARSDRYVIRQYEQETNLRAVVFLDCSRSMAYGGQAVTSANGERAAMGSPAENEAGEADDRTKFHYGRVMAAAVSYLLLHQGDSVGLVLTRDRIIRQVAPRATPGQIMSICHALEEAQAGGLTDLAAVMSQLAVRLTRRSLVVLISDLLDEPERVLSALGQLHHRGHEVVIFQVLDHRELDFDLGFAGRGITIIRDMETGDEFEAEPALVGDLVRAEARRFMEQLDAGARGYGLHLVRCRTDAPVEDVLTRYLHYRLKGRGR